MPGLTMKLKVCLRFAFQKITALRKKPKYQTAGYVPNTQNEDTDCLFLDETTPVEITGQPAGLEYPRWLYVTHCHDKRYSLNILSGEQIKLNVPLCIPNNFCIFVRYAASLPELGKNGITCDISFVIPGQGDDKTQSYPIASLPVQEGVQPPEWRSAVIHVSWLAGRQGHFCLSCSGESNGSWLAVADFCAARSDLLDLAKARPFKTLRIQNEAAHFKSVYKHFMYADQQDRQTASARGNQRPIRQLKKQNTGSGPVNQKIIPPVPAEENEAPYHYASRLLYSAIHQQQPDFKTRLMHLADRKGTVKVLSLCSGAARIEAGFAAAAKERVAWSLLDINTELLDMASSQFSSSIQVDLIEADVNELSDTDETWDIILCVSALHHIVELEKVVRFCHHSLDPDGEFWSIGEYVGRNGNRLWPGAYDEANRFFKNLPEKFRFNHHSRQIDPVIPDNDYSVGCFEGIRSEEIEPILDRWFHRQEVYKANCFLWRLVNLAYSDNYKMNDPEDTSWIVKAVQSEINYFRNGGRGTELYGIYSPRLF
jgi:ubiquinone/menaquinone biosynthesis C-methylase UbiE